MVFRARSRLGSRAPVLGLMLDWLEDAYQSAVANGVLSAAVDSGATVLCFSGGVLGSPLRSAPQRNHLLSLIGPDCVDGIIALSGSVVNHVGPDAFARYCERYRPLPLISIAASLPSIPSVLVDNEVGLKAVVEHFIRAHGHRRIAFVRGPPANEEAERRYQTYRETLSAHQIPFDERLVAIGDFQAVGGRAAVGTWLDERGLSISDIDSIVAANDSMAFGVLEALQTRGIRVPNDIALAGFDDVDDARFSQPPLTTVRQPLEDQGREAVRMMLAMLHGDQPPPNVLLRTELVIRESCGCFSTHAPTQLATTQPVSLGFEGALLARRQRILGELTRAGRGELVVAGAGWESRLLAAVSDELRAQGTGLLRRQFEEMVERLVLQGTDLKICHEVLSCLRREVVAFLGQDSDRRALAEQIFQDVRLSISLMTERVLGRSRLKLERWARQLSAVGASLLGTFDVEDLLSAISDRFPDLGLRSCFIVRYLEPVATSAQARLVLAYDSVQKHKDILPYPFAAQALLPPELLDESNLARSFVVCPLFFKQETLGYMLVELSVRQAFVYEAIRDLISAALKGADLIQAQRAAQEEIRRLQSGLEEVMGMLSEAVPPDPVRLRCQVQDLIKPASVAEKEDPPPQRGS